MNVTAGARECRGSHLQRVRDQSQGRVSEPRPEGRLDTLSALAEWLATDPLSMLWSANADRQQLTTTPQSAP